VTDIVEENCRKLAELLAGRENWRPEVAGEDGARGWCFGVEGAGRLTIVPEMDGFLMVVHDPERSDGPRQSWIIPRVELVGEWLEEHEQEYAGLTPLQVEFREALERARAQRGDQGGGAGA
jgi:hypothetical protein